MQTTTLAPKRSTRFVGGAPALAAIAACLACQRAPLNETRRVAPVETPQTASWPVGRTYIYETSLKSRVEFPGRGSFEMSLQTRLRATPTKSPTGTTEIAVRLVESRLVAANQPEDAAKPLVAELERPWVIGIRNGHADYERFSNALSGQVAGVLRTLAAALQLPPSAVASAPFVTREFDSTGPYDAEYRLVSGAVHRRKVRYFELEVAGAIDAARRASMLPAVLESDATLRFKDGLLVEESGKDRLKSGLAESAAVVSETALSLKLAGSEPVKGDADMWVPNGTTVSAAAPYGTAPRRDHFDDVRVGTLTVAQALARFDEAAATMVPARREKDSDEPPEAAADGKFSSFSALVALVRKDPAARDAVVSRAKQTTEGKRKAYFDVLSSAGTPEAQRSLAAFITTKGASNQARGSAAMSLIRVQEATPETIALFERLVRDPELEEFGIFGLGTAARRLREAGRGAESEAIAGELGKLLVQAKTDDLRIEVLRGIANSANGALLGTVRPFLSESQKSGVREAAVQAVGRVKLSDAEPLLAERMVLDSSEDVRAAAASIAGSRQASATLIDALTKASIHDPDRAVRYNAVKTLAGWLKDHPELRAVLDQIANGESEPKIQEVARRALGEDKKAEPPI